MSENKYLDPLSQKNELVVMSNALVRGQFRYSVVELRLILTVVSMIRAEDDDFTTYCLAAKDFAELIDSKFKDEYGRIKKIGTDLMSKPIILENKQEGEFKIRSWFDQFDYKKGSIYCSFHKDLKPYLLKLKGEFTMLALGSILLMKSRYGMIFFLYAKSWESRGWFELSIEEFKERMGVQSKGYDKYANLKRKVVDTAIDEINRLANLIIQYREIKDGRKVVALRFTITKKTAITGAVESEIVDGDIVESIYIGDPARTVVDLFVQKKKEISANFDIFISSGKNNPYETMQNHLNLGVRTSEQYIDLIKWLFESEGKDPSFWRSRIHNMEALIRNYDAIEAIYIEKKNSIDHELQGQINARVGLMRRRHCSDEEIQNEIARMIEEYGRKPKLNLF